MMNEESNEPPMNSQSHQPPPPPPPPHPQDNIRKSNNNNNNNIDRVPPSISHDTLKKIMWLYRTRTCPLNKRGQCNYGIRCFDSHESQPERRAPKQNEYNDWHPSTMKCTSNVPNENCKYGRACYFAHNDFEVNYHPTMYKTKICNQFDKEGTCSLGMICPNYHYPDEQRKIEKGSLSADCKSDGLSRKAPPPQEFRRWLDEELRIAKKANAQFIDNNNGTTNVKSNLNNINQVSHIKNVNNNNKNNKNNNIQINENNHHNVNGSNKNNDNLSNKNKSDIITNQEEIDIVEREIVDKIVGNDSFKHEQHLNNSENLKHLNGDNKKKKNKSGSSNNNNNGDRERNSQPNIENEVEIELPSSQPSQSLNLSQPDLMLRNVSDSPSIRFQNASNASSPPFVEQMDDKWHQGNNGQNITRNYNNQSRPESHYVATSTSPHLNRALSTPSSLPSVPHSNHGGNTTSFQPLNSNNLGHTLSTASFRSGRSGRSSGNRSQISGKSGKSKKSHKSHKSSKSKSSKSSKKSRGSSHSNKTKSTSRSGGSGKRSKSGKNKKEKSLKKLENKRDRLEIQCIEIVKNYKVNQCLKQKCNDIYCPNYHSLNDRRRSPFQFNYCNEACPRIFDNKTRKFTDNHYGCPMNQNCQYAHNYLEIWYHPNVFHTKQCPLIKYRKNCPWNFKCSHYHKKSQKRTQPVGSINIINNNNNNQQNGGIPMGGIGMSQSLNNIQRPTTYSPVSSSQYSSHSYHQQGSNISSAPPPNLHQHINNNNNGHHQQQHASPVGPQRPPMSNNRHRPSPPQMNNNDNVGSPYSAVSFDSNHHHHHGNNNNNNNNNMNLGNNNHHNNNDSGNPQMRNGLMSPNFDHNNKSSAPDGAYSYNPLMQGIAPSINSWRQKIDNNPTY